MPRTAADGVAQVVQLRRQGEFAHRQQQTSAGMQRQGVQRLGVVRVHKHQVHRWVQILQILAQVEPVQLGHVRRQQRHVHRPLPGLGQRRRALCEAEHLGPWLQFVDQRRRVLKGPGVLGNQHECHWRSPPISTGRRCWLARCSRVMCSGSASPTSSMSPPLRAASWSGPAFRSEITSAAKRS